MCLITILCMNGFLVWSFSILYDEKKKTKNINKLKQLNKKTLLNWNNKKYIVWVYFRS